MTKKIKYLLLILTIVLFYGWFHILESFIGLERTVFISLAFLFAENVMDEMEKP